MIKRLCPQLFEREGYLGQGNEGVQKGLSRSRVDISRARDGTKSSLTTRDQTCERVRAQARIGT